MKNQINKQLVSKLKPSEKPYEICDTKVKGLMLRVQPSGVMTYYCQYNRGKRLKIGDANVLTPNQARDRCVKILADTLNGKDPSQARQLAKSKIFFDYLDNVYSSWAEANHKNGKDTVARLKSVFAEFGNSKLNDITAWKVEKWRISRLKKVKESTINRDLTALKACLNKAVQWKIIKENPMSEVKRRQVDDQIVRFLSLHEEASLRQALDDRENGYRERRASANQWRRERGYKELPSSNQGFIDHLKPLVVVALNTGLRRGELFNLCWKDVDLEKGIITVTAKSSKSSKARHIPLNSEARSTLREWRKQSKGIYVYASNKPLTAVNSSWKRLLAKANIENFRFHDLRHHFASRLVMSGVDLNTVRELLGHGEYKMTLRYAHLAPEHKQEAVEKLVAKPISNMLRDTCK